MEKLSPDIVFRTVGKFYILSPLDQNTNGKVFSKVLPFVHDGGAEGIRTPGLRDANATLSQLSYSPNTLVIITQTETVN